MPPARRPWYSAPCASAASSMTASPNLPRQLHQRLHVGHVAIDVHRHDGAGRVVIFRSTSPTSRHQVSGRSRPVPDGIRRAALLRARDDGKARHDDFRSGRQRESHHRELECRGAVAERHAVGDTAILAQRRSNSAMKRPSEEIQPERSLVDIGEGLLVQQRLGDRNHGTVSTLFAGSPVTRTSCGD